jgi:membrane-associated phospholipid phosphatase
VAILAVAIPTGPLAVDTWWSELMTDGHSARLDRLALAFNDLGRGVLRALTIGAIGLGLVVRRRWAGLLAFACTEALTPLFGNLLKALVDRPRPPDAVLTATGSSFPSGHAAYAAATIVAVILLYNGSHRHRWLWIVLGCLAVAGMAWSRTYLQVHWLSDVVAGACLGAATALAVFAVTQLVVTRAGGARG